MDDCTLCSVGFTRIARRVSINYPHSITIFVNWKKYRFKALAESHMSCLDLLKKPLDFRRYIGRILHDAPIPELLEKSGIPSLTACVYIMIRLFHDFCRPHVLSWHLYSQVAMIAGDLICLLLSNESGCPKTDDPKAKSVLKT